MKTHKKKQFVQRCYDVFPEDKRWRKKNWLALPVGNEGPSTFTDGLYIGDETEPLIPYFSGQLEKC